MDVGVDMCMYTVYIHTCVFMVAVSVCMCVHGGCECTYVCSWWL